MLRRYENLWAELSSRDDLTMDGRLAPEWPKIFLEFPDRFMIGTDTHAPDRWNAIRSNAAVVRAWLAELPGEVGQRIAHKNGEALLTAEFSKRR